MNKETALLIYVIVIIVVFIVAKLYLINTWSAFVLAILTGLIVLFFLTPRASLDGLKSETGWEDWVYFGIWVITILILLYYIIERAFRDRCPSADKCFLFSSCD